MRRFLMIAGAVVCLPVICTAGGPTDDFVTPAVAQRIESKIITRRGRENRDPEEVVLLPSLEHLRVLMRKAMEDHMSQTADDLRTHVLDS